MKAKSLVIVILFIALTSLLSAQDQSVASQKNIVPVRGAYSDKNNDGICDTYEVYGPGRGNGRGAYYGRGAGYGRGNGFRGCRVSVASGAGRYRQDLPQGRGRGFGPAYGRGLGQGQGSGLARGRRFVDNDKDGVCDLYETSVKKN